VVVLEGVFAVGAEVGLFFVGVEFVVAVEISALKACSSIGFCKENLGGRGLCRLGSDKFLLPSIDNQASILQLSTAQNLKTR
jgi:hypothetical protein